jgi:hypothetical protein
LAQVPRSIRILIAPTFPEQMQPSQSAARAVVALVLAGDAQLLRRHRVDERAIEHHDIALQREPSAWMNGSNWYNTLQRGEEPARSGAHSLFCGQKPSHLKFSAVDRLPDGQRAPAVLEW